MVDDLETFDRRRYLVLRGLRALQDRLAPQSARGYRRGLPLEQVEAFFERVVLNDFFRRELTLLERSMELQRRARQLQELRLLRREVEMGRALFEAFQRLARVRAESEEAAALEAEAELPGREPLASRGPEASDPPEESPAEEASFDQETPPPEDPEPCCPKEAGPRGFRECFEAEGLSPERRVQLQEALRCLVGQVSRTMARGCKAVDSIEIHFRGDPKSLFGLLDGFKTDLDSDTEAEMCQFVEEMEDDDPYADLPPHLHPDLDV